MVTLCFKEKGTLIKCLLFLVSVLIMILVALAFVLVKAKKDSHICKSEQCTNLAAEVIKYGDISVNPCEDFHTFTCGNFIKSRKEFPPPPPDEELKGMVAEFVNWSDSKPFILQKSFYLSCSNLGAIEMNQDETILDLFFQLGDWPVLRGEYWHGTNFEWTDVAIKARKLGLKFNWFLDFNLVDVNGMHYLRIDIPKLSPLKRSEIVPRSKLFTKIAVILGAPEKLAHYETGRTIDFENEIRTLADNYTRLKRHWEPSSLHNMTINDIQTQWPNIQWLDFINGITGMNMVGTDYVIFDEILDYIRELTINILGTPKRIVADYMMFKIVEENWQYFSQPVREKFEGYYRDNYNITAEHNRQTLCIGESRKQFPLIAESEYIRRHVTDKKRQLVRDMAMVIRNKFLNMLRTTPLRREAKQRAMDKLEALDFWVGGPKEVFDEFGFADDLGLYGFAFNSTNVVEMLAQRNRRLYDNYFKKINTFVLNRTAAYYEKVVNISRFTVINNNTLVIPAAVLKDAFYNPKLPNYFNYATLGRTLAYEIFNHIFQRSNSTITGEDSSDYDSSWTSDPFDSAVKCLVKESSYIRNSELKRPKKMREFLADFVAPEVAYESYKEWSLMNPQEPKLPLLALEFTPTELFWILTSKLSCNKIYSKHDRDYSTFKIIGPLRNSRYFARDYNCTQGSRMYSRKPCQIL